eukprot:scaffold14940_cov200-Alexandrium_tamarense.AAC.2
MTSTSSTTTTYPTVSIAIPGSVVSNAQTRELQTQLAGQIARAAAVYRVDEIVVFDDGLGSSLKTVSNYRRGPSQHRKRDEEEDDKSNNNDSEKQQPLKEKKEQPPHMQPSTDPHAFLARILQYCECPQYLRRKFFPMHPDLQFAGLLPPLDAPHHLRRGDFAAFREGVVVERKSGDGGKGGDEDGGSFVDCGVPNRLVQIDRDITPGIRCTVKLDTKSYLTKKGVMEGKVVSPTTPRDEEGMYWGYTTRLASSINGIFEECPYEGGYDLKVGTSERGDISIDDINFGLKKKRQYTKSKNKSGGDERFSHLLIVFGGVAGIEECVDADESMTLPGEDSKKMFDVWVNICPYQGSRTIRTEEAVLITLSRLSPYIVKNALASESTNQSKEKGSSKQSKMEVTEDVDFSDDAVSEESSDEE